eukprot:8328725-Alexandrium_andersonii.AAC.1
MAYAAPGPAAQGLRAAWALVAPGVAARGAYSLLGRTGGPILDADCPRLGTDRPTDDVAEM